MTSPADDGCRNTAEFLRLRLQVPIREARRRLTLAHHTLPRPSLTGEPLPATRPHLATALTPTRTAGAGPNCTPGPVRGPAVSSHAATLITATLDRLQNHTTAEMLGTVEHQLTHAATAADPDFLARLAQRWTDTIDADGAKPTEEALRHTQGAFIRKPRHGLHHLEIFATTDQYEHLLTVMNTVTNPRTTGDKAAACQLDGIVTAAKTALTTNTLPTTGGNRPQIIATINYQDLFPANAAAPKGKDHSAETGTGTFAFTGPVTAATLRKIACDADIIPALTGTTGEILDLGRKTRLFTPALVTRDQGCTFPNCTIPAPWCEAHPITYWSHGGPTATNNGTTCKSNRFCWRRHGYPHVGGGEAPQKDSDLSAIPRKFFADLRVCL